MQIRRWKWYATPGTERWFMLGFTAFTRVDNQFILSWRVDEFDLDGRLARVFSLLGRFDGRGERHNDIRRSGTGNGDQGRRMIYLDLHISSTLQSVSELTRGVFRLTCSSKSQTVSHCFLCVCDHFLYSARRILDTGVPLANSIISPPRITEIRRRPMRNTNSCGHDGD